MDLPGLMCPMANPNCNDIEGRGRPLASFVHMAQLLISKDGQHVVVAGSDGILSPG